jgi:hypothetical protein
MIRNYRTVQPRWERPRIVWAGFSDTAGTTASSPWRFRAPASTPDCRTSPIAIQTPWAFSKYSAPWFCSAAAVRLRSPLSVEFSLPAAWHGPLVFTPQANYNNETCNWVPKYQIGSHVWLREEIHILVCPTEYQKGLSWRHTVFFTRRRGENPILICSVPPSSQASCAAIDADGGRISRLAGTGEL